MRDADRNNAAAAAIETTILHPRSTILHVESGDAESVTAIPDIRLARHEIAFVAPNRKDTSGRLASAPDRAKSPRDVIKPATERRIIAPDDVKGPPPGLASAHPCNDDGLIFGVDATD